jgi:hypothetical protein
MFFIIVSDLCKIYLGRNWNVYAAIPFGRRFVEILTWVRVVIPGHVVWEA